MLRKIIQIQSQAYYHHPCSLINSIAKRVKFGQMLEKPLFFFFVIERYKQYYISTTFFFKIGFTKFILKPYNLRSILKGTWVKMQAYEQCQL